MAALVPLKASWHVLLYTSPLLSNGYQQHRKADKEALFLTTAPESLALRQLRRYTPGRSGICAPCKKEAMEQYVFRQKV